MTPAKRDTLDSSSTDSGYWFPHDVQWDSAYATHVSVYYDHSRVPKAHRLCLDCNENPATTDLAADQVVNDVIVSGMPTRCVPCAFKRTRRMVMASKIV